MQVVSINTKNSICIINRRNTLLSPAGKQYKFNVRLLNASWTSSDFESEDKPIDRQAL